MYFGGWVFLVEIFWLGFGHLRNVLLRTVIYEQGRIPLESPCGYAPRLATTEPNLKFHVETI